MTTITNLKGWQALTHQAQISNQHMYSWFENEAERFSQFSLNFDGLLLDYSRNRITKETIHIN